MTTAAFLADLQAKNIRVSADGDRLRCTGPKGALTPEIQSELSRRKADILTCLRGVAASAVQAPPIVPVRRDGPLPLSFAQQRLWFLHQMDPASAAYNLQLAIPLPSVDVPLLARVLTEIVRRHETLRTTFTIADEQPVQIVHPASPVRLSLHDLRGLSGTARVEELRRLKHETYTTPFDLRTGPVVRFDLALLADGAAELVVVQHHIVTDGWSVAVLFEELRAISQAFIKGEPSPLPELPFQYADYACWQRTWLQGAVLERQVAYWRRRLEGLAALELPTDRPRPSMQTFKGATQSFAFSSDLSAALRRLTRVHGVTLYMTLLAGFQALLARYSGQTDIVVGTSNGNRRQVDVERLIGFFVNTQVIRVALDGDPTFADLLDRVSTAALEAYDHQDVPFEKLVEELHPRRDLSRSPLFDVMFILQNTPLEMFSRGSAIPGMSADGIRARDLPVQRGTAKFDLTLCMVEAGDRICGSLEYCTDLFDDETITRMLDHFERLLRVAANEPHRRLSSIGFLTDADRVELDRINETTRGVTAACVHELIAAQTAASPDAIAVDGRGGALTYAALDGLSTRVADALAASGVRQGDRVGVCLERSPRMVAAILGVMKAGAAYVPLDPEYPRARLEYMLADSGATATLTEASVAALLPDGGGARILLDGLDVATASDLPARAALGRISPESAAYVLYTSGTTGRPKGVIVPHRAVVNFLAAMAAEPGIANRDVLLAVTTLAFDIAGLELLLPLTVGARVVVAERADTLDGVRLCDRIAASGATMLQATPATWRMLVDSGWSGTSAVRMLCGGEAMPRALADDLLDRGAELWNLYGPTETTIWSAASRVQRSDRGVALGKPIANTTLYVLDPGGARLPAGIPGELYIGGFGVANGYLNRADLTAERFVPDPFTNAAGARMYRTGDLVRLRADGEFEYIGRTDHQVKLRGFRIELSEIESVLASAPAVAEAIAVIRPVDGEPRLVAYLRAENGSAIDLGEIRLELRDKLPAYMVPSDVVVVAQWPRTPNGKIDRKALPAPAGDAPQPPFLAPATEAERKVADIWRDVLRVDRVGASDNFFDLGGHSLLIVPLQARLSGAFNREVRVVDLFRFPTVQALARHLTQAPGTNDALGGIQDRASRNREAAMRRRQTRQSALMRHASSGLSGGQADAPAVRE